MGGRRKILFLLRDYMPRIGGSYEYYHCLCKLLKKKTSFDPIVVTRRVKGDDQFDIRQIYKIIRIFLTPLYKKSWLDDIQNIIFVFYGFFFLIYIRPRCVVCEPFTTGLVACVLKLILRVPFIVILHGEEVSLLMRRRIYSKLTKWVLEYANLVICNSNYTRGMFAKYGLRPKKVEVINPGIEGSRFMNLKVSDASKNKKILLTVGRIVERKGQDMVLRSLPNLLKKYPNLFYRIVGAGPLENNLRKLAKELHVERNFQIVSEVRWEELSEYYQDCDIFVMPNRETVSGDVEGFGTVFIEANAWRKPVIGGKSGGAVEAIEDGRTGILVNGEDVSDLEQAIDKLLSHVDQAVFMGDNGRLRALENYNWETRGQVVKKIFENVIEKRC